MAQIIPSDVSSLLFNGERPEEVATLVRLRDELPDAFTVFHGIHWSRERKNWCLFGEIDFVVVNPLGHLLVIEQKNGAVEERGGTLVKQYRDDSKDIAAQVHRSIDALREKFKRGRTRPPALHVDYLIYLPDHQLVSTAAPGLDGSRIVDAADAKGLGNRIEDLLGGSGNGATFAKYKEVMDFLTQSLRLVPDVSSYVVAQDRAFVSLTNSLADTVRRLEFAPFRLRIVGAAGSGKSQLALDFCTRMAVEGRAPLYICFNRPLADRIRPLLPAGATCDSYHQLITRVLTEAGLRPDFSREGQSPEFWQRLQEQVIALQIPDSVKYGALVVDEGQDMQAEWFEVLRLFLTGDAPILWVEDPDQNIYRKSPLSLPGFVSYRDPRNFRTPRTIARFIERLLERSIDGCNPAIGLGVQVTPYEDPGEQPSIVAHRVKELVRTGFRPEDVVVISCVGLSKSPFSTLDELGSFRVRRFTNNYTPAGEQVYTDGRILWDTLYRFKGQQAPAVILVDVEPPTDEDHGHRMLYCGMTRPTARLELVINQAHPSCTAAVDLSTRI